MPLSQDAIEALTANDTSQVFLFILRVNIDGVPVFSCVNNTQAIVSNGVTYEPVGFNIILPSQNSESGAKSCKLSIDNLDGRIMECATNAIGKTLTVDISVILAATPDIIERGPIQMILRNVTATKDAVSGDLYDFYIYDRIIPEGRYTPKDFPGLFGGGYS